MNIEKSSIDPRSLPSIELEQRKLLPNCSAVYFLFSASGECLYVGRSGSLGSRVRGHNKLHLFKEYAEAKIAWLECSDLNLLFELEGFFIEKLNPPLNQRSAGIGVKTIVHPVRFTDKEYDWLKQQAEEEGVSVGEIVRELVKRSMRSDGNEFRANAS